MAESQFSSLQIRVLVILALINLVNYVDRQVLYPLFPLIAADYHLTHEQLGILAVAFSLVHAISSLPLGRLGDIVSRRKLISGAIFFWSGATFLSGLAGSFRSLIGARALVGVGEAAYTPASTAMITATFPRAVRARVQGVFDTGMFIGGAGGIVLGGLVAAHWGWRSAFFIVGVPGLLLALCVLHLPEVGGPPHQTLVPIRDLLRIPAFLMIMVSGWFSTFAAHAYIIWGPMFVQQCKGFSVEEAGVTLGGILVIAGISGVTTGAAIADRLTRRYPWGRALTVAFGFLVSAPLLLLTLHASHRTTLLLTFSVGCFFMTWYHGPVTAITHDLTPPRAHATAMAIYYFWVNLFAVIPAAWLVGKIADHYDLMVAIHSAVVAQAAGGCCFLIVTLMIRRQRRYEAGHSVENPLLR